MASHDALNQSARLNFGEEAQVHGGCGFFLLDQAGRIQGMNQGAFELFGLHKRFPDLEQVVARPLSDLIHGPAIPAAFQEHLASGALDFEFSAAFQKENGEQGHCFLKATRQNDADKENYLLKVLVRETTPLFEAVESLRRSRERYARLRAAVTDYVYTVYIEEGCVLDTVHSKSCEKVTGYSAKDFQHDAGLWIRMVPDQEQHTVLEKSQDICSGKAVPPFKHRIIRKDGQIRWVQNTPVLYHNTEGDLIAYDGLIRDITPQYEAETRLKESERRYRRICEAVTDYMYTVRVEYGQPVASENGPGCEAVTGYSPAEFRADPFLWIRMVPNQDQQVVREQAEAILLEQNAFPVEHRIRRKDGHLRWVRNTPVLQYSPNGDFLGYDGLIRDITERKEADLELLKAHKSLEDIFNAAVPLCVVDHNGIILRVNQAYCDFLGQKLNQLQQKRCDEVMGNLKACQNLSPLNEILQGNNYVEQEVTILTRHRGEIPCLIMATPYEGEDAQGKGMVMSLLDLSEQKRAQAEHKAWEKQVQKTQKLESLGVLAGGIAHDFNNLLMGILGNADLIRQDLPDNSPALDFLDEIEGASKRAADLCGQMLAYSGRGRFQLVVVHCNDLVQKVIEVAQKALAKNTPIHCELSPQAPCFTGDPTQAKQILMNLILNAAEASTEKGGAITVSAGLRYCDQETLRSAYLDEGLPAGHYAFFEVRDTGSGMDEQVLARLFDPFFTTKFTGRGLGLAAVLGIVRGHQGAVHVESTPGEGTTFRVYFPATEEKDSVAAQPKSTQEKGAKEGIVLIVDDDENVLHVTGAILGKLGFKVLTATSGAAGIKLFQEHQEEISLIVMDLTMPEMSGEKALLKMREIKAGIPVLFTSGFDQEDLSESIRSIPQMDFLHKPFAIKEFKLSVQALLDPGTEA